MPLKQSLVSFALYSMNLKYISSFSACCLTLKVCALERVVDKTKKESCQENCSGRQAKEAPRTPQGEF